MARVRITTRTHPTRMFYPASLVALLSHRRPLLLQGPMGPFFARFARFLEAYDQQVRKVNFNGGDELFYGREGAQAYTGSLADWPAWLERHVSALRIDALVMFGQSRPVHEAARRVAARLGISVFVFEEGYLRPHYVTLEHGGVNGYSTLPRERAYYSDQLPRPVPAPQSTNPRFHVLAWYACLYLLAMLIAWPRFRRHVYHRSMHPVVQSTCWVRSGVRKLHNRMRDRGMLDRLTSPDLSGRWFLFPLQVHNDAQLLHHSRYGEMEAAIEEVLASFAAHAPADAQIVLKHHPMDRPYTDYRRFIADRVHRHGLFGRVHYVHDLHLPSLLKHARGVVTVNSTTGLQALNHGTPVHTLGDCFYALPGLVHLEPLAAFWSAPGSVDRFLYERFRQHLVTHTQLNASFHGRAPVLATPRLRWQDDGDARAASAQGVVRGARL